MQNCRRKAANKTVSMDRQTDGRKAMAIPVYPTSLRSGGYNQKLPYNKFCSPPNSLPG